MKKVIHIFIYLFAGIGFFLTAGYFAVKYGLTNTKGIVDNQRTEFLKNSASVSGSSNPKPAWAKGAEWQTLKDAILKDVSDINKAGALTDISPRLIVSILIVEQLRLFYSDREVYKQIFAPLKILGTQSQFSWGVMGIKPETAKTIEQNLKNTQSDFYPGSDYKNLLDFKTSNPDQERFARLVNEKDRYYSYLYSGTYLKEVKTQWQKAGYPIDIKVDILATLFNIGFANSKPNAAPQSGGAEIEINGVTYSFGSLAKEFYDSSLLTDYFSK